MKSKLLFVLLCLATLLGAFTLTSCEDATATPKTETPVDTGSTATALYVDTSYTYGFWDQIIGGEKLDFAIGDYNTTVSMEAGADGGMKVTVGAAAASAGWSAGTLAQVPDTALTGSYFDFTNVANIKFKVRGTLPAASIKFKIEAIGGATPINEVAITSYGVATVSATDWSSATVPVSSFTSKNIKGAFIVVLGTAAGYAEFKEIAFVDSTGANVDIAVNITY